MNNRGREMEMTELPGAGGWRIAAAAWHTVVVLLADAGIAILIVGTGYASIISGWPPSTVATEPELVANMRQLAEPGSQLLGLAVVMMAAGAVLWLVWVRAWRATDPQRQVGL